MELTSRRVAIIAGMPVAELFLTKECVYIPIAGGVIIIRIHDEAKLSTRICVMIGLFFAPFGTALTLALNVCSRLQPR